MQIKNTTIFHFTPTKMIITNKLMNNKCWQGCEEKGILFTVGGNADLSNHCETTMEFPQKNKNGTKF